MSAQPLEVAMNKDSVAFSPNSKWVARATHESLVIYELTDNPKIDIHTLFVSPLAGDMPKSRVAELGPCQVAFCGNEVLLLGIGKQVAPIRLEKGKWEMKKMVGVFGSTMIGALTGVVLQRRGRSKDFLGFDGELLFVAAGINGLSKWFGIDDSKDEVRELFCVTTISPTGHFVPYTGTDWMISFDRRLVSVWAMSSRTPTGVRVPIKIHAFKQRPVDLAVSTSMGMRVVLSPDEQGSVVIQTIDVEGHIAAEKEMTFKGPEWQGVKQVVCYSEGKEGALFVARKEDAQLVALQYCAQHKFLGCKVLKDGADCLLSPKNDMLLILFKDKSINVVPTSSLVMGQ